jgi:hypothetical protein
LVLLGCHGVATDSTSPGSISSPADVSTLFEHLELAFPFPSEAPIEPGSATFAPTELKVTSGLEQWLATHDAIVQACWIWVPAMGDTTVHIRDLRHEKILLESKLPLGFQGALAVVFVHESESDVIALCTWDGRTWSVTGEASASGECAAAEPHAQELEVLSGSVTGRVVQGGSVAKARLADKDPTTCQIWTWYGSDAAFIADELDRFTHPNTRANHRFATRARQMRTVPLSAWTRPVLSMSARYSMAR